MSFQLLLVALWDSLGILADNLSCCHSSSKGFYIIDRCAQNRLGFVIAILSGLDFFCCSK